MQLVISNDFKINIKLQKLSALQVEKLRVMALEVEVIGEIQHVKVGSVSQFGLAQVSLSDFILVLRDFLLRRDNNRLLDVVRVDVGDVRLAVDVNVRQLVLVHQDLLDFRQQNVSPLLVLFQLTLTTENNDLTLEQLELDLGGIQTCLLLLLLLSASFSLADLVSGVCLIVKYDVSFEVGGKVGRYIQVFWSLQIIDEFSHAIVANGSDLDP